MEIQVKTEVDQCMISETNCGLYDEHSAIWAKPEPQTSIDVNAQSEHSRYCGIMVKGEDPQEFNCSVKPEGGVVNATMKPENGVHFDITVKRTENPTNRDSLKLEHPEHEISMSVDLSTAGRISNANDPGTAMPEPLRKKSIETAQRRGFNPKVFHCEICGKDIKQSSNFQEHRRMHSNERLYECRQCHKRFNRCADLIKHRLVHSDLRPYACPVCGKCFKQPRDVTKHQAVHMAIYPFLCSSCGKRFKRAACLIKHERVHSAETPFRCPTCGRSFKWVSSLKEHERTHSGERPFVCEVEDCRRSFARRSVFLQHRRAHLNNRQFHCQYCHQGFNHCSNLRKHEQAHCPEVHGGEGAKPQIRTWTSVQEMPQNQEESMDGVYEVVVVLED